MIKLFSTLVGIIIFTFSHAQNLPNIQLGNQWLADAKIDGKLKEWPINFRAYNKATYCTYTIANDDKSLYFAIRTEQWGKIQAGGVTFILDQKEITYPYVRRRNRLLKENRGPLRPGEPRNIGDFKEIQIKNIPEIKDTLISIYNTYGIKVQVADYINKDGVRICDYEIAIPLKLIRQNLEQNNINYTIKLNGIVTVPINGSMYPIPGKTAKEMAELQERSNDIVRVSQLSGKYTLATKPR